MAQNVQINHSSGGAGRLHYSGQMNMEATAPPWKTTSHSMRVGSLCCLGSLNPITRLWQRHSNPGSPQPHPRSSWVALSPTRLDKQGFSSWASQGTSLPHLSIPSSASAPVPASPPSAWQSQTELVFTCLTGGRWEVLHSKPVGRGGRCSPSLQTMPDARCPCKFLSSYLLAPNPLVWSEWCGAGVNEGGS